MYGKMIEWGAKTLAGIDVADIKSKGVRGLAALGIVTVVAVSSFFYGMHVKEQSWVAKTEKQATAVANTRASNAIDASHRLGTYTRTDAELDAAVTKAKQEVADYYAQHPVERKVLVTKLVPIAGEPGYVYVPDGVCPNDFLNADELRLWNEGNKGNFADTGDSK